MDEFANKKYRDKHAYFELTADKYGLSKEIIEKDFWVCWLLKQVFALQNIGEHLIFKGGTSLSKAYKLIERFSEDIDISIDKQRLGFSGKMDPEHAPSKKRQQQLITDMSNQCRLFVQGELKNMLMDAISEKLTKTNAPWRLLVDVNDTSGQSLLFEYPTLHKRGLDTYIRPSVKIELGARGAGEPTTNATITPFIEELNSNTLKNPEVYIKTLSAERTFWEKATILHMYCH